MKNRKTTHLATMRVKMQEDQQKISEQLDLSSLSRNTFLWECGMNFLATIYPENHPRFIEHSRSKLFWKWYQLQFANVENWFCRKMLKTKNVPLSISATMYYNDMTLFCIESNAIQESFKNYLKAYK